MEAILKQTEFGFKILGDLANASLICLKKEGSLILAECTDCKVDCSDVERVDSASLALLLSWVRCAKEQGKKLVFLNMPKQLQAMSDLYGLNAILLTNG